MYQMLRLCKSLRKKSKGIRYPFCSFVIRLLQETEVASNYFVNHDTLSRFINTKAVVCSFAYQPCDMFSTAEYPLAFFLADRKFAVGQIIAYFFLSFHSKRNKSVSRLPFSVMNFSIQFVGIKTGYFLFTWNEKIRGVFSFLFDDLKRRKSLIFRFRSFY